MKKCKKDKCLTLVSDPEANYCKRHAGKNPKLDKEFEKNLLEYAELHFPRHLYPDLWK